MKGSYNISDHLSYPLAYKLVCFFMILFPCIDCSQAIALSYTLDRMSESQIFHVNNEDIQKDKYITSWTEMTNFEFDQIQNSWKLAPYPVHMGGGMYYALVFEEQSILVPQVQISSPVAPKNDILPIPECPTLILMGIGLLGLSAYIRTGFMNKNI